MTLSGCAFGSGAQTESDEGDVHFGLPILWHFGTRFVMSAQPNRECASPEETSTLLGLMRKLLDRFDAIEGRLATEPRAEPDSFLGESILGHWLDAIWDLESGVLRGGSIINIERSLGHDRSSQNAPHATFFISGDSYEHRTARRHLGHFEGHGKLFENRLHYYYSGHEGKAGTDQGFGYYGFRKDDEHGSLHFRGYFLMVGRKNPRVVEGEKVAARKYKKERGLTLLREFLRRQPHLIDT